MGFFQRLFSAEYRKAVAAEAAGDFVAAARSYALCRETLKVSDMHLAQARRESTLEGRIASLRSALDFAGDDAARHKLVQRLLAEALRRLGQRQGPATADGRTSLLEAGGLLEAADAFETSGDVFMEAGDTERAVGAYSKAGLLERVEELLAELDATRGRDRRLDMAFKDYELHLQGGQRDAALAALHGCIDAAREKGEYRRLARDLEDRLLKAGRVALHVDETVLWVFGLPRVVLGRDARCDFVVRGPSVSREHAAIDCDTTQRCFSLADAGSRNGTQLNGLTLSASLQLAESATIGLGDSATLLAERATEAFALRLRVTRGLDRDKHALLLPSANDATKLDLALPALAGVTIAFREGRPWLAAPGKELRLGGKRVVDAVQLISGDELEISGVRLEVRG